MELDVIKDTVMYLTEKMGVGVEEVYKIFLSAQMAHVLCNISTLLLMCLFAYLAWHLAKKASPFVRERYYADDDFYFFYGTICFLVCVASFIGFSVVECLVTDTIFRLVAPEYMAVKDMIKLIR